MLIQPLDMDGIYRATAAQIAPLGVLDIAARMNDKHDALYMLRRLVVRAMAAYTAAAKFGYIGVGAISFRDARLAEYQRRAMRLVTRRYAVTKAKANLRSAVNAARLALSAIDDANNELIAATGYTADASDAHTIVDRNIAATYAPLARIAQIAKEPICD